MTTKHTPGPWAHRNGRIYSVDREQLTIAHIARSVDGDYSPANGQLIAAAPELLEALSVLYAVAAEQLGDDWAAVTNAAAVIAKARGAQ